MAKTITIRYSRENALKLGLLICECGYPPNNHFGYTGACAHNDCKKYKEIANGGTIIKPKRKGKKK